MSTKSRSATATEVQCVTDLFENLRTLSIQPHTRTQSQWIVPVQLVQLAQSKLAQQSAAMSSLRVGSESGESGWLAMYQVEVKVDRPDGHQEKLA